MIYKRGNPACFDAWGKDNPGWDFASLLPVFKRSENNERGADENHATGGPLNVADQRDPNVLSKAFVEAAVEAGYPARDDFNAGTNQEGFGLYQVTQKGGFRNSSAGAFLHPALSRDNIAIQAEAHVLSLIVENARCVGVRFKAGDDVLEVKADAEVILSAGAYGSPQILMLSGIGPSAELEALGIDVVHDLPGVGKSLQDHFMVPVGTCKMGSDDMAVVDAELRVHGIAGLRVADASIMPKITNGNTNAPSIMIGERASDFIRA